MRLSRRKRSVSSFLSASSESHRNRRLFLESLETRDLFADLEVVAVASRATINEISQGMAQYTISFENNTPDLAEGSVGGWVHNYSPYSPDSYPTGAAFDLASATASGDLSISLVYTIQSTISDNYINVHWDVQLPAFSSGEFTINLVPQVDGNSPNNDPFEEAMISGWIETDTTVVASAQMSASVFVYDSVDAIGAGDCGCGDNDPLQGRLKTEVSSPAVNSGVGLRHFTPALQQSPISAVMQGMGYGSATVNAKIIDYTSPDSGVTVNVVEVPLPSASDSIAGGDYRATIQPTNASVAGLASGVYEVRLSSSGWTGSRNAALTAVYNSDQFDNEFGGGWSLPGLSRLAVQDRDLDGDVDEDDIVMSTHFALFEDGNGIVFPVGMLATNDRSRRTLSYDSVANLFSLVSNDGRIQVFNQAGLLITDKDKAGNERTFTYADKDSSDGADELVLITEPDGRETEFGYTGSLITTITDGWGRVTTLHRNLAGEIESVEFPDADPLDAVSPSFEDFTYNVDGSIATRTRYPDPDNALTAQTEEYSYDADGRLESIDYPNGQTRGFTPALTAGTLVSASAPVESVTVEDGIETRTQYTRTGQVAQVVRNYVASPTDPYTENLTTTYTYWAEGDYDYLANDYVSSLVVGQMKSQIESDPDGYGSETSEETEYWYDHATGRIAKIEFADGSSELSSFDVDGNLIGSTDRRGFQTLFAYDNNGNKIREQVVVGMADVLNFISDPYNLLGNDAVTTWEYGSTGSDILGLPTAEINALGVRTEYTYTVAGKLATLTLDAGGATEATQHLVYDANDQLSRRYSVLWDPTAHTGLENDDERFFEESVYDALGRLVAEYGIDPDGDAGPASSPETTHTYDGLGRQATITDPLGRITEYVYALDGLSVTVNYRDSTISHAILSSTTQTLDSSGRVETGTNALGYVTTYGYDVLGRRNSVTLPDPDGPLSPFSSPVTTTVYDGRGRILSSTDARSQTTTHAYSNFGREVTITLPDPDGGGYVYSSPFTERVYDAMGNLVEESQNGSITTTYEYDRFNRLVKVTQPDPDGGGALSSPVTEYIYDKLGNQRFVVDPLGNITEFVYDAQGRLVEQILPDPDGVGPDGAPVMESEYDDEGRLVTSADALDRITTYTYDRAGRLLVITLPDPDGVGLLASPEISYTYDVAGRKLTQSDPLGNVTSFEYDELDRLVEQTQPDPDGVGGIAASVSSWTYDAAGQMLTATDPLNRVTSYAYDRLGRTITVTQPDPDGIGGVAASETRYAYDPNGNLLETSDPLGHTTAYEYDYLNRQTLVTDALDGETSFTYDALGNLYTLTDPVGNTTTWYYDNLNRVTQEANQLSQTRYFAYDAVGNLTRRTDRLGRDITFKYDNLYRATAERWWDGVLPGVGVSTSSNGSRTHEVQQVGFYGWPSFTSGTFTLTFDSQTTAPIAWDADAATVKAALEALSNIGDGDVSVEKYEYSSSTEQRWTLTFDGALTGNLAQVTIDASSVYNGGGSPIPMEWTDSEGSVVNEVQVVTLNNTTSGTFTLGFGGQTTVPLDWDATPGEVDSALESLSGAGTVSVSGSAGGPFTITFTGTYSGQNIAPLLANGENLVNANLVREISFRHNLAGELLEVTDPDATYEFTYDGLGRVTNLVQNIVGLNPEIEFENTYDAASRRTALQAVVDSTNDFKNVYGYDDMLRLTGLTQEGVLGGNAVAEKRIDLAYNAASQYARIDRYADTAGTEFVASSHYSYDGVGRLLKLVHAETTISPTSGWGTDPLAGYAYAYDLASRIQSIDSYIDGLSEYTHDDTNQLTDADHTGATDEAYEYDANGNRVMSGYDVDPNNQLASDGVYNYTYDNEGNRLTRTKISNGYVTRYEWDHRNRLKKVIEEDNASNVLQVTEQSYDAFNQWIRRNFDSDGPGGATAIDTFFAYENGQIVLQFDGDDAADLSHRYLWGENVDQLFADEQVSSLGSAGNTLWPLSDHLGTTRDLADYDAGLDDTTIANHRVVDSYGNVTVETNAAVDMLFGYTGRALDEMTGLQNNTARWYEARIGSWLSEDPLGFRGTDFNLQRYVFNRILDSHDPTGLLIRSAWDIVTGALDLQELASIAAGNDPGLELRDGTSTEWYDVKAEVGNAHIPLIRDKLVLENQGKCVTKARFRIYFGVNEMDDWSLNGYAGFMEEVSPWIPFSTIEAGYDVKYSTSFRINFHHTPGLVAPTSEISVEFANGLGKLGMKAGDYGYDVEVGMNWTIDYQIAFTSRGLVEGYTQWMRLAKHNTVRIATITAIT